MSSDTNKNEEEALAALVDDVAAKLSAFENEDDEIEVLADAEDVDQFEDGFADDPTPDHYTKYATRSDALHTIDPGRIGMVAEAYLDPATGEKVFTAENNDGMPLFVAAHPITGKIWLDSYQRRVVIDPRDGKTYVPYEFRAAVKNPAAPTFTVADINALAARRVAELDEGFVAFLEYIVAHPPMQRAQIEKINRKPWERFNARLMRFVKFLQAFAMSFYRGVLRVERLVDKIRFRKQNKAGATLAIEKEDLSPYLNPIAMELLGREQKSTYAVDESGNVYNARNISFTAPLDVNGKVKDSAKQKLARLLNKLANDGIWQRGVLAPPSSLFLARVDLRYEKQLFVMIYVESHITDEELNERYGDGQQIFQSC